MSQPGIADIARDPLWLAHRYDPQQDAFHLRHVDRARHRAATFLTDEYLGIEATPVVLRRRDALAAAGTPAPLHFLFHSAFCCSTLLARAVDRPGMAMGLKEPVILNDLVGWKRRGGDPRAVAERLDGAMAMLARPFGPSEAVVVKPSNIVNCLAPAMLAMRPAARAVLLTAPLRVFLGSVAKKGMWGRLWVRELLIGQLQDGIVDLGFAPQDYLGLTDLQVAAVGWLVQQALFARLVAKFGDARIRTLDSDGLMAAQPHAVAAMLALFALPHDPETVAKILSGPAFTTHSKFSTPFDATARTAENAAATALHADEIDKVAIWADAVAKAAGVPMTLPAALLD